MSLVRCRTIVESDWPSIMQIQSQAYYAFAPESENVMRSKAARGPDTSFVAVQEQTEEPTDVVAYCLAYPYPSDRVAVLGQSDTSPATPTDNLFLHDLAVSESAMGRGVALTLFEHVLSAARAGGYRTMSLVAVQQAESFWLRMGFSPSGRASVHASYAADAMFMMREL